MVAVEIVSVFISLLLEKKLRFGKLEVSVFKIEYQDMEDQLPEFVYGTDASVHYNIKFTASKEICGHASPECKCNQMA